MGERHGHWDGTSKVLGHMWGVGGPGPKADGGGPAVAVCAAVWASLLPTLAGLGTLWLLQPQLASPH